MKREASPPVCPRRRGARIAGLLVTALLAATAGAEPSLTAHAAPAAARAARAARAVESDRNAEATAVDPLARARAREELMSSRAASTELRARAQALAAYRLARRRGADFLTDPGRRVATARALDAALLVLRRSATETAGWRRELGHARSERAALEKADGRSEAAATAAASAGLGSRPTPLLIELAMLLGPGADLVFAPMVAASAIQWPTKGTLVSGPGLKRDPATGTDAISESIEILSRMNEPVRAVAAGRVRKIEALPQGGYAVVIEHSDDRVSILSGLRQIDIGAAAPVTAGQPLGLVGRDLDGAPVLLFELWQAGAPLDPRPLLVK